MKFPKFPSRKRSAGTSPAPSKTASASLIMALEPRIMFDAAVVATGAEAFSEPQSPPPAEVAEPAAETLEEALAESGSERTEVVFIDTGLKDWEVLRDGVREGLEVILLDPGVDGLQQMADALEGRSGIDAVHVLSHGSNDRIFLGSTRLTSASVDAYATVLEQIGATLSQGADLLFYGCDIANTAGGKQLVENLAILTQADVAASEDTTGHFSKGGDWDLEAKSGDIEADNALDNEGVADYLWQLPVPSDGVYSFVGATQNVDGTATTADGFFVIDRMDGSGRNSPVEADAYGAFLDDTGAAGGSYTSYIEIRVADGGSFYLTDATIGEYWGTAGAAATVSDFTNVYLVGYANGSAVAQTDPVSSIGAYQTEYPIDYSPLDGVSIDSFRVYYTTADTTEQESFNVVDFSLSGASTTPVVSMAPPSVSVTATSPTFTENGSAVDLFNSVAAATNDSGQTFSGMTLTVSNVGNGSSEILSIGGTDVALTNGNGSVGGIGSYNVSVFGSTATVTLTGMTRDNAQMSALIDGITYQNTSDGPVGNSRAVTITQIVDSGSSNNTAAPNISSTVTLSAVNDAPVLDPAVVLSLDSIDEDAGPPVSGLASGTLVSALVGGISDVDTGALQGIAIIGADSSQGTWWFTTDGGASWSALGTPAESAARLLAADAGTRLHFQPNADWNGTLPSALTVRAWDRSAGSNGGMANIGAIGTDGSTPFSTATDTVALTANSVPDAPTAINLNQSKGVTEGGSAIALDDIVVTDGDAGDTITATLTLSNPASGSLSTGTFGSATSTFNAGTGEWTVTGVVADVNAALAAVALTPSANNDQSFTITTRIRDAADTGPADGTISVTVTAAPDAPTASNLTQSKAATEGGGAVALDDIIVTDVDSGETITATLTLSNSAAGTLSTGSFGSATSTFDSGTGVWTVTGSVADVNAALAAVALTPSADNDQNFTIATRIRDAAGTGPADGIITVSVTPTNDAPTATNLTRTVTYTEGASSVGLDDIVVSDVDAGETITATLTLNNPAAGTLTTGTYGSATSTYNGGSGIWTVTGSAADVNAALAAVAFAPSTNWDQDVTITTQIRDAANTGPANGTITLDVAPMNDAPSATNLTQFKAVTEGGGAVVLDDIVVSDVDTGETVTAILTLSNPAAGSLSVGTFGAATSTFNAGNGIWTVTGSVADVNAALAAVAFTPSADNDQNFTIATRIRDAAGTGPADGTIAVTVTPVNDAPVVTTSGGSAAYTEGAVPTAVDAGLTLTDLDNASLDSATVAITGGFQATQDVLGFANVDGTMGNISASYDPATGVLTLTSAGATASVAQWQAALRAVTYANSSEQPSTAARTVSFTVSDGDASSAASARMIAVTAVNDAPTNDPAFGYVNTGASLEVGQTVTITNGMLHEGDPDDSGTQVTYIINTAPSAGTLFRDANHNGVVDGGEALGASSTFTQGDIDNGLIRYRHSGGAGSSDSFAFSVADGGEDGAAPLTGQTFAFTISERPVVVVGAGSSAHTEDGSATVIAPSLALTDGDSTQLQGAVVTITDYVAGDVLSFTDQNGITGSFNAGTGILTLAGTASVGDYQAALRSVTYNTSSDNPATGAGNGDRVIEFRVTDNGGLQSLAGTNRAVTVVNANDAPELDSAQSPQLTGVTEDAGAPMMGSTVGSTLVSSLLGGMTDVDTGALQGMALVGTSPRGTLWYSTDGGTSWTQVPAVSANNALLLQADARLYFQPATNFSGSVSDALTFRAWDRSSGSNGGTADTSTNGAGTAFSTTTDTVSITVAGRNDAPTIGAGPFALAATNENSTSAGGTTASILAGLGWADVDSGAASGMAVIGASGNGVWQYSTDGSNWYSIGTVSTGAALLLDASTQVRYVPDGANGETGGAAPSLDIRAWDQTSGTASSGAMRNMADTTFNGGTSAYSSTVATARIDVLPVNDAPFIASGANHVLTGTSEDAPSAGALVSTILDTVGVSDVDNGALSGIAVTAVSGGGTWQYSNDGTTWTSFPAVSGEAALLLASSTQVRLLPDGLNGGSATFSFRAWDQSSGTASTDGNPQTANANSSGGSTAFSSSTATASIAIAAVNDAPVITAPVSIGLTEDIAADLTGISFSDVDANTGTVTATFAVASGSLAATSDAGVVVGGTATALTLSGSIGDLNAFIAAGGLSYQPVAHANGDVALTVSLTDNGNTGSGGALSDTANVTLAVAAVNDAPTVTAPVSIAVTEDLPATLTGISFSDIDAGTGSITATFSVPGGTLSATSGPGVTVGGTATALTLTGTVADINAFVAGGSVAYTTAANAVGDVILTVSVTDSGNTGSGGTLSDTASLTLQVSAVNDAPVITAPATIDVTEDAAAALMGISFSDVDVGGGNVTATFSVASGSLVATSGSGVIVGGAGTALTLTGSINDLNAFIAAGGLIYQPVANANGDVALTMSLTDNGNTGSGGALGDTASLTLQVSAVNDAPMITAPASIAVTEDVTAALTGISFSDIDGGTGNVTATFAVASGSLAATSDAGVIAGGTATALTLTGSIGDLNAFIAAGGLSYQPAANANGDVALTVSLTDNGNTGSGGALSDTANVTLAVAAVNDAPTVTAPVSIAVTEDLPAALTGISFSDIDAGTGSITATFSVPGGALSATSGPGVTVGGTATALSLTGTVAELNAFIASGAVSYTTATNATANVALSITVADGGNTGAGGSLTDSANVTLQVTAVNDAPAIGVPSSITVTEDASSALTGISFSDIDAGTGSVTATFSVPGGALSAASGPGVTVGGTATALTLTGTVADLNAFIAGGSVAYTTAANAVGDVILTVSVTDNGNTGSGGALSDTASLTLQVSAVNDAPVITAPATIDVTEDVASALSGISFSDVDAASGSVTATLTVNGGTLAAVSGAGVTVGGTATALTLTGTVNDLNAFIAGGSVAYTTAANAVADVTLGISINDNGNTGSGGALSDTANVALAVAAVNDAPAITAPSSLMVTEDVGSTLTGISFADVDAGAGAVTAVLTVGSGTLAATPAGGVSVTGADSGMLTLTGSVANLNAFIASGAVSYTTAANATAEVALSITVADGGNTGSGGSLTDSANVTLQVSAVNDAPAIGAPSSITVTEDASSALTGISFSDIDAGTGSVTATFSVPGGALSAASGPGVTVGGTATALTLTGTVNDLNAFIAGGSVAYTTAANAVGDVILTVGVNDNGNTGSGGALSDTASLTLQVSAVNDAPVITAPATIDVTEDAAAALTGISFSDVDVGGGNVTATFSVASGSLVATSGSGVIVGGAGTAVTLTGSISDLNAFIAAGGLTYQPVANANGDVALTMSLTDNGNTGSGGALGDTASVTLAVAAVNDGPVNAVPGGQSTIWDVPVVFSAANGNAISISDVDAGTVQVTLGASHGALSLNGTAGLVFTAGDGNSDGAMTFSGSVAAVNAALNGLSFTPAPGYFGPASLEVITNDLSNSGSGGSLSDTDTIAITVDSVQPVVTAISALNPNGSYGIGDTLTFAVSFDQRVTVDTNGGLPALLLASGPTQGEATYVGGSGTDTLTFSYTVRAGDISGDLDAASNAALVLNGASIRNVAADNADLTLPGGADSLAGQHDLVLDGSVPTVTEVAVPATGSYVAGDALRFTVGFSESVTVSGGVPQLALVIGDKTVYADYVSGSGSGSLVFQYVVQPGDNDANGIALANFSFNGAQVRDGAGNDLAPALNGVASTGGITVDTTAPTADVNRVDASPTAAGAVQYRVTFSEAVTGVDMGDFSLATNGNAQGTIASVSQVDAQTYMVMVNGLAGEGDLRLDVNASGTGIADRAGNALSGGQLGATYELRPPAPVYSPPPPPVPPVMLPPPLVPTPAGTPVIVAPLQPLPAPTLLPPGGPDAPTLMISPAAPAPGFLGNFGEGMAIGSPFAGPAPAPAPLYITFGESSAASGLSVMQSPGRFAAMAGDSLTIQLPASTFAHSDPAADVTVEVSMADGSPLPPWLRFDAATGTLTGQPPTDQTGVLRLRVVARDSAGDSAAVDVELEVRPVTENRSSLNEKVDPVGAERPVQERAVDAPAAGKPALAEQFDRLTAKAQSLELEALMRQLAAASGSRA